MGDIHPPAPVLLIVAASSRHDEALDWARERIAAIVFGPIALVSDAFDFTETDYYAATMGADLKKQFLAFERLIDPARWPASSGRRTSGRPSTPALGRHAEPRPLNLDPGYITPAKLVLASTKDHAHRIYLAGRHLRRGDARLSPRAWQPMEWTYPDYRRADYQEFFTQCREYLLRATAVIRMQREESARVVELVGAVGGGAELFDRAGGGAGGAAARAGLGPGGAAAVRSIPQAADADGRRVGDLAGRRRARLPSRKLLLALYGRRASCRLDALPQLWPTTTRAWSSNRRSCGRCSRPRR